MSGDAIILFIHYPEKGSLRPALAGDVGARLALELETCFIRDLLDAARSVDALPIVIGTGSTGAGPPGVFGDVLRLVQHGRGTGGRRYNAFADVFGRGLSRAVMLCGNSPGLSALSLRAAFSELDYHDAVLGPLKGGDYFLLGLTRGSLRRELFGDIPWDTSRVFVKTMGIIEDGSLKVSVLPQQEDILDREGLVRFARDPARSRDAAHTLACIERHRDIIFGNEDD